VIVQNKITALKPSEAAAALATAYERLIGAPPSSPVLALLIAQSALETGNWKKIHNYNFGNQKAGATFPLIVQFRCSEIVNGVEKFFDPPAPECNFRAYEDAAAGALDYLRVLHARPHWWQGLLTEDPSAFVDALATPPKYFTANPALYKSALTSLFLQYRPLAMGVLGRQTPPASAPPTAPQSSSTPPGSPTLRPLPGPQSPRNLSAEPPSQGPAAGSASPSGWDSLPSGSWLVPQEDLVGADSGVRTSVARFEHAQARKGGAVIESAPRPGLLVRLLRFIARLLERALGRRSA